MQCSSVPLRPSTSTPPRRMLNCVQRRLHALPRSWELSRTNHPSILPVRGAVRLDDESNLRIQGMPVQQYSAVISSSSCQSLASNVLISTTSVPRRKVECIWSIRYVLQRPNTILQSRRPRYPVRGTNFGAKRLIVTLYVCCLVKESAYVIIDDLFLASYE